MECSEDQCVRCFPIVSYVSGVLNLVLMTIDNFAEIDDEDTTCLHLRVRPAGGRTFQRK